MEALNDYIVIKPILEEAETKDGLYAPSGKFKEDRYFKGVVVKYGKMCSDLLNVDETVYYDGHAGHSINIDSNSYRVIKLRDIVLIDENNA